MAAQGDGVRLLMGVVVGRTSDAVALQAADGRWGTWFAGMRAQSGRGLSASGLRKMPLSSSVGEIEIFPWVPLHWSVATRSICRAHNDTVASGGLIDPANRAGTWASKQAINACACLGQHRGTRHEAAAR